MEEKQYTLGMFIDTQGAFYSRKFAERHNVGKTMIRWNVNMLSCNSVHLTYRVNSAEAKLLKVAHRRGTISFLEVHDGWQPASATKC